MQVSFAQTITIYPTAATLTGYSTAATNVTSTVSTVASGSATPRRAWAVFNLATLPPGASVTSCIFGYYQTASAGAGTPTLYNTHGYAGNITTLGVGTRYTTIATSPILYTATYLTTTGNHTLASTAAANAFVQANAGNFVSIATEVVTSTRSWTWTNGGGTASTTAINHKPYLQITYSCTGVSGVSASATPTPLCAGDILSLTGNATGASTYSWSGPGGFSSTQQSPVFTVTTTGTYTFTAFNALGCPTKATVPVTVNASPTVITGNLTPCLGTITTLGSTPVGTGVWSVSGSYGATISGSGVFTPGIAGTSQVTYTLPSTGCHRVANVTVLDTPTAIIGPPSVCTGATVSLNSSPGSGTWLSLSPSVVSIGSASGLANGLMQGTAVIKYTATNGCHTSRSLAVVLSPAPTITSSTGSFLLCPLLSLTLNNANSGSTWSESGGHVSVNPTTGFVTGLSVGVSTVSYGNKCGVTSVNITVTPPPPPITGVFSACVNQSSLVHDSVTTGVWSSNDMLIAAVGAGTGLVQGVSAGTTTITYTDVTGCVATTSFLVNPLPNTIGGSTFAVCYGTTISLLETTAGGKWSSQDSLIANIDSAAVVSGRAVGQTTISYTLPATGCYITAPVTVNPLPVPIAGNNSFCNLTSDSLSDVSLGGAWSSSNTGIASISPTGNVTGISGGSVTITYTLPTTCYAVRQITINPLPVPNVTYNSSTETFSTGTYYLTYQWYLSGVLVPGANSYNFSVFDNDIVTVVVTDTFGCRGTSVPYNMHTIGIQTPVASNSIAIRPNPASGWVHIESPVTVKAVITSIVGKIVLEQQNVEDIDVSQLTSGMYLISLFDNAGNKLKTEKLVKE